MKAIIKLNSILLLGLIFLASCSKGDDEVITPTEKLDAKFEVTVTGDAPNASLTITNNSTAATSYEWTFGEGASITSSSEKTPALTVEKAGGLEVTLKISDGKEDKTIIKTVVIPGNSPILTFADVEFSITGGDATYGRFFSTETGLVYKNSEVTSDNGSKIDIAFDSFDGIVNFFETPNESKYNIPNATLSKFVNYVTSQYDIESFDSMIDDALLNGLEIVDDAGSFPASYNGAVLFENFTGKKGVMKVKAINSKRVIVDIKVQKY